MESIKIDIIMKALATSEQKLEACLSAKFKAVERKLNQTENKSTPPTTSNWTSARHFRAT
jgi:hypothetical protein